jgi:integrase
VSGVLHGTATTADGAAHKEDLYTLSRRMGHSSITITADKYGHLYQSHNQDAEALDQLLKRKT